MSFGRPSEELWILLLCEMGPPIYQFRKFLFSDTVTRYIARDSNVFIQIDKKRKHFDFQGRIAL